MAPSPGLSSGMDIINGAIESLLSSAGKEDWTPVILSIADTTLAVIKEKARGYFHAQINTAGRLEMKIESSNLTPRLSQQEEEEEVVIECRVRFLSFMGVGRDAHTFAFIMDTGNQHFQCHVFWCDPNAGSVSEAVQTACVVSSDRSGRTWMRKCQANLAGLRLVCSDMLWVSTGSDAEPCFQLLLDEKH